MTDSNPNSNLPSNLNEEKELAMWKAEWATLGGSSDLVTELAGRVKKSERRLRLAIAIEILAAALTTSFAVWFVVVMKGAAVSIALLVGFVAFNATWLTRLLTNFRRMDPAASDVAAFVTMTRRRHADGVRWIDFAKRTTVVLGVGSYAWIAWVLNDVHVDPRNPYAIVPLAIVTAILVGLLIWFRVARGMIDRKHARFEALIAERTLE